LRLHRGDQSVSFSSGFRRAARRRVARSIMRCHTWFVSGNLFVEYSTGSSTSDTLKIALF
jgi:hypothetical protein